MTDLVRVRRALISVSDKSGVVAFARELASLGVEIISTGGTAQLLAREGVPVVPVEQLTGFPEMMDGRLKTLHPRVHGGILGVRGDEAHEAAMREHGINPIDLVCVNLYPFEEAARRAASGQASESELIENIDIGGPAMIRSAAKNFAHVVVVVRAEQYAGLLSELRANNGATTLALRRAFSREAFARTSEYDAAIASAFASFAANETSHAMRHPVSSSDDTAEHAFPDRLGVTASLVTRLRYGENPHQSAAAYRENAGGILAAEFLHGKELSYNNVNDADAAQRLACEMERAVNALSGDERWTSAVVVKHTNPCGAATRAGTEDAVRAAIDGDPLAAYGGVMAIAGRLDVRSAERLCDKDVFLEVLIARSFDDDALDMLRAKSKNLRILCAYPESAHDDEWGYEVRSIIGGLLVQSRDSRRPTPAEWVHRAGPAITDPLRDAIAPLECIARALTSNAVCIALVSESGVQLVGAGAGQMDRVASCRIAVEKAGERLSSTARSPHAQVAVAFSDAFFPFDDGPRVLIDAGVQVIVHPGGSKRDADTFALCDARGVTCLTTGIRHFRH